MPGRLFLFTAAMSEYGGKWPKLERVKTEADRFYSTMHHQTDSRLDSELHLLDELATKKSILDGMKFIGSKCGVADQFVIFLSGHGQQRADNWYLLPYDAGSAAVAKKPGSNWISGRDLAETLVDTKSGEIVLIVDCCYAGGVAASTLHALLDQFSKDFAQRKRKYFSIAASSGMESAAQGFFVPSLCAALTDRSNAGRNGWVSLATAGANTIDRCQVAIERFNELKKTSHSQTIIPVQIDEIFLTRPRMIRSPDIKGCGITFKWVPAGATGEFSNDQPFHLAETPLSPAQWKALLGESTDGAAANCAHGGIRQSELRRWLEVARENWQGEGRIDLPTLKELQYVIALEKATLVDPKLLENQPRLRAGKPTDNGFHDLLGVVYQWCRKDEIRWVRVGCSYQSSSLIHNPYHGGESARADWGFRPVLRDVGHSA